jgi:hypothetical protein
VAACDEDRWAHVTQPYPSWPPPHAGSAMVLS